MQVDPIFKVRRGNYVYPVGHLGHFAYWAGAPGSGKSTNLCYAAASALKEDWVLDYRIDLKGRSVLIVDGEQPPDLYKRSIDRIYKLCEGLNTDRLIFSEESFCAITNVKDRRREMLEFLIKHQKDAGVIFIDRIANFVADPNNTRESEGLQSALLKISDKFKPLMIPVFHTTPQKYGGGETKLFGMQGSLAKQISSWGILNVKQSKYFGVLCDKSRYGAFPPMWCQFKHGELIQEPYCPF